MMKVKFNINYVDKSEEFLDRITKKFAKVMYEMEADAKRLAPVDTGRLRNAINIQKISDFHFILRDGVNYGIFVEFGTKPHVIKVKTAKALHWEKEGEDFFAKYVMHPGTNAKPFFRPAYYIAKEKIKSLFF